ncbi:MAG: hypothetical protein HUJ73_05275 [Eubacterium sp.]|nr:hypothetical protein [Eubacterium sp.]
MKIQTSDKILHILEVFPGSREELPKIDSRFNILRNPLAKAILKEETLETFAAKTGIDAETAAEKLNELADKSVETE